MEVFSFCAELYAHRLRFLENVEQHFLSGKFQYELVYDVVQKIPKGKVASYGQVAEVSGYPGRARQVGYALAALGRQERSDVPWHRVVNSKGEISLPSKERQQSLLEEEGVVFKNGKTAMKTYGWVGL